MTQQPPGKVRRQPNYPAFLATGALAGLLIGFLLSVRGTADPRYEPIAALGFFGLICAGLGVLTAGVIAVLLDRRT